MTPNTRLPTSPAAAWKAEAAGLAGSSLAPAATTPSTARNNSARIRPVTSTPTTDALEISATLPEIKQTIETSGHSRIPVYDGTLDHIVGVLYARDLLKHLGESAEQFDIRSAMRAAIFVPETKPLRDLLRDFKLQKVHIAIVLDEYGGTAGLVTIEDILEELVGEISDEHEPAEPAMLRRVDRGTFEADARLYIDELNRQCGLSLPEDAGYDTLGGFLSTAMGRIPQKGQTLESGGVRYTVLDAEPQRVKRVKIELLAQATAPEQSASASPGGRG
jgi:magnesium and cobalt transporter